MMPGDHPCARGGGPGNERVMSVLCLERSSTRPPRSSASRAAPGSPPRMTGPAATTYCSSLRCHPADYARAGFSTYNWMPEANW